MSKLPLYVALAGLVACGGNVVAENSAGTTGSGGSTTGTGASTTTGTGASTTTGAGGSPSAGPCPASVPAPGDACAGVPENFRCTWGDSVLPNCRQEATCMGGVWGVSDTFCNDMGCPTSEPSGADVCPSAGQGCAYGDNICFCGCADLCAMPLHWECSPPPTTPGCPAVVPNDGTSCSAEGVQCNYGDPCTPTGAIVNCTNGLWKWNTMIACGG